MIRDFDKNENVSDEYIKSTILCACLPSEYQVANTIAYLVYNREAGYEKKCQEIIDFTTKFNGELYEIICNKAADADVNKLADAIRKNVKSSDIRDHNGSIVFQKFTDALMPYYTEFALGLTMIDNSGDFYVDAKGCVSEKIKELTEFCEKYAPKEVVSMFKDFSSSDKYKYLLEESIVNWKKIYAPKIF